MIFEEALLNLDVTRNLLALPVHWMIFVGILVWECLIEHFLNPLRVGLCCQPAVPYILGNDHVTAMLLVGHVELTPAHEDDLEEGLS